MKKEEEVIASLTFLSLFFNNQMELINQIIMTMTMTETANHHLSRSQLVENKRERNLFLFWLCRFFFSPSPLRDQTGNLPWEIKEGSKTVLTGERNLRNLHDQDPSSLEAAPKSTAKTYGSMARVKSIGQKGACSWACTWVAMSGFPCATTLLSKPLLYHLLSPITTFLA